MRSAVAFQRLYFQFHLTGVVELYPHFGKRKAGDIAAQLLALATRAAPLR